MLEKDILELMPEAIELNLGEMWEDPTHNILVDDEWAREVGRGERLPTVRLWRHAPVEGLVVSKRDVAGDIGESAIHRMADEGWSVIVRPTGGTAVPHGSGVLNLSLLLPRLQTKATTEGYYRLLCQPILDWLENMGLAASTGELPGSYCDGKHNVLVDGKKLVGTAQAWRGGIAGTASRHPGYVLAHACIVIEFDLDDATEAINRFYSEVGNEYRVERSTSTSLAELLRSHGIRAEYSAVQAQVDFAKFLREYYTTQGVTVRVADR